MVLQFWTIETVLDGPSYVTLDISLVGGQNYDETADPIYLEETYPMLISPSGTELLIAKGETGICLPFRHMPAVHVPEHNSLHPDADRRIMCKQ